MFSKSGTLIAQISESIFDRQHYFQVKLIIMPWPLFMDIENASGLVDTELWDTDSQLLSKTTRFYRNVKFMCAFFRNTFYRILYIQTWFTKKLASLWYKFLS